MSSAGEENLLAQLDSICFYYLFYPHIFYCFIDVVVL